MTWHYWAFLALTTFLGFCAGWEFATRRLRKRIAQRLGYELNDEPFIRLRGPNEAPIAWFFFSGLALVGAAMAVVSLLLWLIGPG